MKATKQLATILGNESVEEEFSFKRSLAISQHHDAVSGTEKQHVTDDYAMYLYEGLEDGRTLIRKYYKLVFNFNLYLNYDIFNCSGSNLPLIPVMYHRLLKLKEIKKKSISSQFQW